MSPKCDFCLHHVHTAFSTAELLQKSYSLRTLNAYHVRTGKQFKEKYDSKIIRYEVLLFEI